MVFLYHSRTTNHHHINATFVVSALGSVATDDRAHFFFISPHINGAETEVVFFLFLRLNLDVSGQRPVNRAFTLDPPML